MSWRFLAPWKRASVLSVGAAATLWQVNDFDKNKQSSPSCSTTIRIQEVQKPKTDTRAIISSCAMPVLAKSTASCSEKSEVVQKAKTVGKNFREQRFLDFASLEYDNIPYLSPQDFLESVTQNRPRFRKKRKNLSKVELDTILNKTPSRWWTSSKLFRNMGNEGIISYSEYIFLLCILAKPKSGFEIAFNMIDLARNNRVDKNEFTILNKMMSKETDDTDVEAMQDTSLMIHFFGKNGKGMLKYKDFNTFMDNIQTEILEMEFTEFSKGLTSISETEFARVLLRYTNLTEDQQSDYIERITSKLVREEGISFEDFKMFFQFLNNLEDFSLAMKLYTLAGQPINQEEFQRAVKACVGYTLPSHVVATVFLLFDKDDDGHLSYQEFLSILRDRLRGLSSRPLSQDTHWDSFKRCVSRTLKEESL